MTMAAARADLSVIKARQQKTWASGDYAVVASRIVLVSELLADAGGNDGVIAAGPGFLLARLDDRQIRARCCHRHNDSSFLRPLQGRSGQELASVVRLRTSDRLVPPSAGPRPGE